MKQTLLKRILTLTYCTSLTLAACHASAEATGEDKSIVLGSGCFWGAEKRLEALPGVIDAVSGYADGKGIQPNYQSIIDAKNKMNPENFAEVVQVTYNPSKISLADLYKHFFENHDPTQMNRQGNDIGTQYRSTILYNNEEEARLARSIKEQYQTLLTQAGYGSIKTKIAMLETFYPAEEYHQDYLKKNPNDYCPNHATGVTFGKSKDGTRLDNTNLLKGKHILVVEAPYCPYCSAFKDQVAKDYLGDIPMHFRQADNLESLEIITPTWASPTILFLEDGKEVFGNQGFMTPDEFYRALGGFKLGQDSESYKIAFNNGTERRFCQQYHLFKDTGSGVFIDKVSGQPLFETKDRFDSGSGWLSFIKAIDGATIEIPDHSHGLSRMEVRAKHSHIHLGHVFEDGPNGQRRFCINANVLEFKPQP